MISILITVIKKYLVRWWHPPKNKHFMSSLSQTFPQKAVFWKFQLQVFITTHFRGSTNRVQQKWDQEISQSWSSNSFGLILFLISDPKIFQWTQFGYLALHSLWRQKNHPVKPHFLVFSPRHGSQANFDALHKRTRCTLFNIGAWASIPRCCQ